MCIEYKIEVTRNKILALILLGAFIILLRFIPVELSKWYENSNESQTRGIEIDATSSKILAMMLLGGVSILLGFIPMKFGHFFKESGGHLRHETVLSTLLCFGGGVLLATSFLHMLPEVRMIWFFWI